MQNFKFYEIEEVIMPGHVGWGLAGFGTGLVVAGVAIGIGIAIT